jgi:hypothetical protein
MRQYFWRNCFDLRFKIDIVVMIIWSIVIIIKRLVAFDGRESVQLLGVSQVPYSGPGLCRTASDGVLCTFNNKTGGASEVV